jgi:outer membrane lipoprotein carrier protein
MPHALWFLLLVAAMPPESVRERWRDIRHLSASFTQETYWSFLDQSKMVRGHIWFKSPNRFRIELSPPDSQIVVSDGESLWVWTPEVGYAARTEAPTHVHPLSWLHDADDMLAAGADSAGMPAYVLQLPPSSPWERAVVWVDSLTFLPRTMRFHDRSSRRVTYRFLHHDTTAAIPADLFTTPP